MEMVIFVQISEFKMSHAYMDLFFSFIHFFFDSCISFFSIFTVRFSKLSFAK